MNLNLAQRFFNLYHSFAILLDQLHLLEFQDFVSIGLDSYLVLLLCMSILKLLHLLLELILLHHVLILGVFSFLQLILAIGFERLHLISDCLFESVPPFAFSSFLSNESFIDFLLVSQCTLN